MSQTVIVTLSDPIIQVDGWNPGLDRIGEYTLKIRKTPEEMKKEREYARSIGDFGKKIDPVRRERRTVISKKPDDPSVAYFLPGLWPRVEKHLKSKGIQYTIVDKRNPDIRPALDMTAFEGIEFRKTQDVAVALISQLDCGIIETVTGWGKSALISWMCKAYPTLNIVVTTGSAQVVGTLYQYLCQVLPGEVGVIGGGKNIVAGKRVIVSTFKSLPNINPENVHLVFVDECHGAADNDAGREIMKFCWARRFGFSASPIRNAGDGIVMESLFGPTILKMEYDEAVDAGIVTPMKYLMLPCNSAPSVCNSPNLPDVMQKRWSYWCNRSRNEAIRKFVYDIKKVYDGQLLIMCNSLEHCIHIQRLLPWFKIAYGGGDFSELKKKFPKERFPDVDLDSYKLTAKQLEIMRKAFEKGTMRYIVCTKTWRAGVNFKHLRVLVRADGDVSAVEGIQIPGRLSRLDEGKDWAYLVDVMDNFSQWARQRSFARQALYEKQSWKQASYEEVLDDLSRVPKENDDESAG